MGMGFRGVFWTESKKVELLQRLEAGESCTQIGVAMGATKNSVCGAINRYFRTIAKGIFKKDEPMSKPKRKRVPPKPKSVMPNTELAPIPPNPVKFEPRRDTHVPSNPRTLLELEPEMCRWPIDDGPRGHQFKFCGDPALVGHPYCEPHCRMSYAKLAHEDDERAAA